MKMLLWIMVSAVLVISSAGAEMVDKGLPAQSSTVLLKPTAAGYQGRIDISPDAGVLDAKLKSSDERISRALTFTLEKTEARPPGPPEVKDGPANQKETERAKVILVNVSVNSGSIPQGSYPLALVVTAPDGAVIERELQLTVPPATIDVPDTLVVLREEWDGETTANEPQIWEKKAQRAWLTGITLAQKGDTDAGGEPAGHIVAKQRLDDIPPRSNGRIQFGKNYELVGDFPLGTAKGKLVVQADQLAEPVSFGFEIRSRILRRWLFLALLLGLGLGWITRYWLQGRMTLNQERQKAFALIELIDGALNLNQDHTFEAAAQAARTNAAMAATQSTAEAVKNQTLAAQTAFQTALDDLHKRRGDLDQAIANLLALVRIPWRVPQVLTQRLTATKTELEQGLPGLDHNDVGAASTTLDGIRQTLGTEVVNTGGTWLSAADGAGSLLDGLEPLLGTDQVSALKTAVRAALNPIRESRDALVADPNAAFDRLQAAIERLHAGVIRFEELLRNTGEVAQHQIIRWDAVLGSTTLPAAKIWRDWTDRARELARLVSEAGARPENVPEIEARLTPLILDLKTVLLDQLQAEAQSQLMPVLEAGKYTEAVAMLPGLIAASRPRALESREGSPPVGVVVPATVAPPLPLLVLAPVPPPTPVTYGVQASAGPTMLPIAVMAAMSRRALQGAGIALSSIYAAVIAAGGYFLFADKWIGTPLDFATVFFWAFVTDIGADAATAAARGVKQG